MKGKSFLDQLNLRPAEKRVVFVIIVVLFFVFNYVWVWPHFGDWTKIRSDLDVTRAKTADETKEIVHDFDATNGYKKQLAKLERQQKGGVSAVFDESLMLQKTIGAQAPNCGVDISSRTPGAAQNTNEFFDEQTLSITFEAGESNLVNFLYNVGNDPSMVRIRELRLDPVDPGRYKLRGSLLLAANYEKRTPPSAEAKAPFQPGAKPASGPAAPGTKPKSGTVPNARKVTNAPPSATTRNKT
jgi:hypothetical protein